MGGMIASQCSVPLPVSGRWVEDIDAAGQPFNPLNSMTAAIERLMPDQECLGDILDRHGNRNVYLGGTLLSFAGKGAFLASRGFEEQYGWIALRDELPDPDAYGPWGCTTTICSRLPGGVSRRSRERLGRLRSCCSRWTPTT